MDLAITLELVEGAAATAVVVIVDVVVTGAVVIAVVFPVEIVVSVAAATVDQHNHNCHKNSAMNQITPSLNIQSTHLRMILLPMDLCMTKTDVIIIIELNNSSVVTYVDGLIVF